MDKEEQDSMVKSLQAVIDILTGESEISNTKIGAIHQDSILKLLDNAIDVMGFSEHIASQLADILRKRWPNDFQKLVDTYLGDNIEIIDEVKENDDNDDKQSKRFF